MEKKMRGLAIVYSNRNVAASSLFKRRGGGGPCT